MNKFLTAVFAATLLSSTALAGERKVEVETPKSITVVCSDDVPAGTVVLSNPPKFSCKDLNLVNALVGTGVTIGPDANIDRIARALRREIQRSNSLVKDFNHSYNKNGIVLDQENVYALTSDEEQHNVHGRHDWIKRGHRNLDDFNKQFPGISRNQDFFVS